MTAFDPDREAQVQIALAIDDERRRVGRANEQRVRKSRYGAMYFGMVNEFYRIKDDPREGKGSDGDRILR